MRAREIFRIGESRGRIRHRADQGKLDIVIPLDWNPPAGAWKVVVTDVVSRSHADLRFDVAPAGSPR